MFIGGFVCGVVSLLVYCVFYSVVYVWYVGVVCNLNGLIRRILMVVEFLWCLLMYGDGWCVYDLYMCGEWNC